MCLKFLVMANMNLTVLYKKIAASCKQLQVIYVCVMYYLWTFVTSV